MHLKRPSLSIYMDFKPAVGSWCGCKALRLQNTTFLLQKNLGKTHSMLQADYHSA